MPSPEPGLAIPAQLSFLAIYNPSLGQTDETLHDQIVFYFSHKTRRRGFRNAPENDFSKEDENEKLRQVGLAQGMVEFARSACRSFLRMMLTDIGTSRIVRISTR